MGTPDDRLEEAPYRITFDAERYWLSVRFTGFWTDRTVANFRDDLLAAIRGAHLRVPACRTLGIVADCRDYPVQSREAMDAWTTLMGPASGVITVPHAILVGSMLSKIQAQRAFNPASGAVFTDQAELEAWLSERTAG